MQPVMNLVGNLGYVAVAISGSILAIKGVIKVGDIQAFIQYVRNLTQPMSMLAQVSNMLQSIAAAAERVLNFWMRKRKSGSGKIPSIYPISRKCGIRSCQFGIRRIR